MVQGICKKQDLFGKKCYWTNYVLGSEVLDKVSGTRYPFVDPGKKQIQSKLIGETMTFV